MNNTAAQERLAAATAKYEAMKAKYEAVQENAKVAVAANQNN
jgi:hypothetical protein